MRVARRGVLAAGAAALLTAPGRAAPFVPARDPQVVAFAPSGTLVATGCSGLSDGSFPPRPHPDVRKCAVVAVWDVATRKRVYRWDTFGDFTKLAFSPDGRLLAACRLFRMEDGVALDEVRVWDLTTGRVRQVMDRCHAFDFSPDARQIVVLSRSRCVIYDTAEWGKQRELEALGGALSATFAADGLSLVGVVADQESFRLRTCSLAGDEPAKQGLLLKEPFYTIAVAANGSWLGTGHDGGNVVLWNATTLDVVSRLQTGVRGLAHPFFSPDGALVAGGCQETGDVVIWSVSNRQETARYTFEKGSFKTQLARSNHESIRPERDPGRFCFSPDGEAFLAGCYGGILRRVSNGAEMARFGE